MNDDAQWPRRITRPEAEATWVCGASGQLSCASKPNDVHDVHDTDAINYFNHDNDYWTSKYTDHHYDCQGVEYFTDLWLADAKAGYEGPAKGMISQCPATSYEPKHNLTAPYIFGLGCKAGPQGDQHYGGYEDATLVQHVVALIGKHEPTTPLFLFWAPHVIHTPLQVPPAFYHKFDFIAPRDKPRHERQIYAAMVNFADA
eukprot:COSAG05_NODE_1238_length_5430_cov_48.807728_2_plen_201_part_00